MTPTLEPPCDSTRTHAAPRPAHVPVSRRHGTAQDLLGLLGAPGSEPAHARAICVQFRSLPARAALFHEGTSAEALHVVRSGTFKCLRTDAEGGERVLGFARRGDVLGYGAIGLGRHTSAAVALEPSSVAVVPLADLFAWLQRLPALERALHQALSLQHARADELSDVRAVVPAEVRLARFLLHWSHRMAISGQSVRQLKLAMSRRDIARLLGVAHETVSRAFGSLATRGCVAVTGRTVDILDPAALLDAARTPIALHPPMNRGAEGARPHRIPALP
jgi:CRP/FNR family transcriptional regulator